MFEPPGLYPWFKIILLIIIITVSFDNLSYHIRTGTGYSHNFNGFKQATVILIATQDT